MLKIRALNRDSLSDEDAPAIRKEAQEEISLDLYNTALRLRCNGKLEESDAILQQLLKENIPQLESQGGLPKTMSTLKYSCYINLGSSAKERNDIKLALDNYLIAADLDKTDVTLWYKIGTLALKLDRFRLAIYAFAQGLECNDSYWPCLDQLIVLLYAIRDTVGCLFYITKALILDPNYTRGLVLRKFIYESNSGTRQYYKLFNPDYILEPDLDVSISKWDEKRCMEDVESLCVRINEIEKSLGPKPLPCIPLPTPLKDFTWLSLGQTIIDLHQYISDNKMSHFCTVDLTNEVNQIENEKINVTEINNVVLPMETQTKEVDVSEVNVVQPETDIQVVENEQEVERRMSVTSENCDVNDWGTENNLNSSQAEDNDEMDQDTEDQEEMVEQQKTDKQRGTKRRRNVLLDLQVWGWHSKRKKSKSVKDLTIEDALRRIIPDCFLPNGLQTDKFSSDDSMNTMDIYKSCVEKPKSPNSYDNKENYFGSQIERDDVYKFWTKQRKCCDAVLLIEALVHSLASMWQLKWPPRLVLIYLEAYKMYREHFEHPPLWGTSATFVEKRNDALATLLYGELYLYQMDIQETNYDAIVHPTSLAYLQLISTWNGKWKADHLLFFIRVHWLRAHIYRKIMDNTLAIRSLQLVQQAIMEEELKGEKFKLFYSNCGKYAFVTLEITEKLLRHLEMMESLSRVEQLYNNRCYVEVVEILQATFLCTGSPPTYGKIGRPAQLGILMDSLWHLDRRECFIWTEKCLYEAVGHFLRPLKDKEKWEIVLNNCLTILDEIIKEETVIIMDVLTEEQRIRLIKTLCHVVCCQLNDSRPSLPLGTVVPWIVMHYALLREEHRKQAKVIVSHVRQKHGPNNISEQGISNEKVNNEVLPSSIAVLFSAHEFMGRKGWCLVSQGKLLHFIIDQVLDRLDTPIFEHLREKIDFHLEQAFFCLYQHPSKKNKVSRHLADHNVNPLPLEWERAQQLYEFFCPDHLPEFDSYKSLSITSDLEQLLQRIIVLVPTECNPQPYISRVSDFVNGIVQELPSPIEFPNKIRAIYYLLGDYYFKQNEISRCVKYFLMDICVNPLRLDTWADLGLGYASQLENKLNYCEGFKCESEFLEKAKNAKICFQQSFGIVPNHMTLWIEFGAFQYMVHSFCARLLKYESDTFSMERFEMLESQKESYLDGAGASFSKALDLYGAEQSDPDERWLHHYMLGKVAEKRRSEPVDYLQHFLTAAELLNENNAQYPEKINYYNPQHLSIEALELYYRVHASILKYLELHEGKSILNSVGKMFKKCLDTAKLYESTTRLAESNNVEKPEKSREMENSKNDYQEIVKCVEDLLTQVEKIEEESVGVPNDLGKAENDSVNLKVAELIDRTIPSISRDFECKMIEDDNNQETVPTIETDNATPKENKPCLTQRYGKDYYKSVDEASTASSSSSDSSSSDSDSDDSSSSSSSTCSDGSLVNMTDSEVLVLVDRCIDGLEQCIIRYPQNYKALYRLAHLYFHYKARKDVNKSKRLLLSEYKCKKGIIISGLFADHKVNNFFNGVWRIPSSEIDRPGSLAAHMNRCVTLLLQVLRHDNDHKTLLDVCLQLKRTPDADKIYVKHADREQLAEQALSLCVQSLKEQIKNLNTTGSLQKLVLDLFKSYQRVQKYLPPKESTFSSLLADCYKKFMKEKLPENVNVLDLAIKFCQQQRSAEKLKQQQQQKQNITPPPAPIISGTPVVLPTPSNVSILPPNPLLKKPTIGRPRGRPPGPKQPGAARSSRGRSSSQSISSWKNMYDQTAMRYMLKYQEELLRQYNTITQMNAMGLGQLSRPPLSGSTSPLLNSNQLVQMFTQMMSSGLNPLPMTPFSQGFGQGNSSLYKKSTEPNISSKAVNPSCNYDEIIKSMTIPLQTSYNLTTKLPKATYTTASFGKNLASTSSYKPKLPDSLKVNIEEKKAAHKLQTISPQDDYLKAASMLNDRPNITITPVTQNMLPTTTPLQTPTTNKTLQEKLADKQKQHSMNKMSFDGKLNEGNKQGKSVQQPFSSQPSSIPHVVNLPSFSLESGISISQLPPVTTRTTLSSETQRDLGSGRQKSSTTFNKKPPVEVGSKTNPPSNLPLSVSVFKKKKNEVPEAKPILDDDDDVIIIE